jgi:hypothetical protein
MRMSDFTIRDGILYEYTGQGGEVTIPEGVSKIGYRAFFCCPTLTRVNIPDSVRFIDAFAFFGCPLLTSVSIPDSVERIEDGAFMRCRKLDAATREAAAKRGYKDYEQSCPAVTLK